MTRPTPDEVDEALRVVAEENLGADDPSVYLDVLADEVRALREDLEEQRLELGGIAEGYELEMREAQRRIARVEAVLDAEVYSPGHPMMFVEIEEVRAALRGES